MEIRAAVLHQSDGPFQVETLELSGPASGEAVVRLAATGVCHTDFSCRRPGRRKLPLPAIFGHEGAGIVESVGPGVERFRPGDHVVLSYDSCGRCAHCHSGRAAYCDQFDQRNLTGLRPDGSTPVITRDGSPVAARWFGQSSFATHVLATERNMVRVEHSLPLELLAPLGCGIQTGAASVILGLKVGLGASIAVFGVGSVGIAAVMAARAVGAGTIIAVDPRESRRLLALEYGATTAVDAGDFDALERVRVSTGGVDFVLDTSGSATAIRQAIGLMRTMGRCGLVGAENGAVELRPTMLIGRHVTFFREGNAVPQTFIPFLIELWGDGRLPFDKLITHYGLDQINQAEADSRAGAVVKPVLLC